MSYGAICTSTALLFLGSEIISRYDQLLNRRYWQTRQQLTTAIFDYVEVFFNRQRLHSTLGYLSPSEFEEAYALQEAA